MLTSVTHLLGSSDSDIPSHRTRTKKRDAVAILAGDILPAGSAGMSNRNGTVKVLLCVWLVSAQAWYYGQFRELLWAALSPLLHSLWR